MTRPTRAELTQWRDVEFDPESKVSRLLDLLDEYEKAITWDTTCLNCSNLMDKNYEQYCRLDKVRDLVAPQWRLISLVDLPLNTLEAYSKGRNEMIDKVRAALEDDLA